MKPIHLRFINEYCVDENGSKAAVRAGYSPHGAGTAANRLLKNVKIQAALKERMAELVACAGITPEFVVGQWASIARADPTELVQVVRRCCRYCHGEGHAYQWTPGEYAAAALAASEKDKPAPDASGGLGYDANREPNPACPECAGDGESDLLLCDTRKLSKGAKLLYNGAERTRNGIKIHVRNRDDALQNLARYLGILVDKREVSGPNGGPIPVANLRAEDLTDEQLVAILAQPDSEVCSDGIADEASGEDFDL